MRRTVVELFVLLLLLLLAVDNLVLRHRLNRSAQVLVWSGGEINKANAKLDVLLRQKQAQQ